MGTRTKIENNNLSNFAFKKASIGIPSQEMAFKEQNDDIVYDLLGQ